MARGARLIGPDFITQKLFNAANTAHGLTNLTLAHSQPLSAFVASVYSCLFICVGWATPRSYITNKQTVHHCRSRKPKRRKPMLLFNPIQNQTKKTKITEDAKITGVSTTHMLCVVVRNKYKDSMIIKK